MTEAKPLTEKDVYFSYNGKDFVDREKILAAKQGMIDEFFELMGHQTGGTMGEVEGVINKWLNIK